MEKKVINFITYNGGNMKSWLVPTFQFTTNADIQFFILRVIASVFIINILNINLL